MRMSSRKRLQWVAKMPLNSLKYSRSSRKRPPRKFEKGVLTKAGRLRE